MINFHPNLLFTIFFSLLTTFSVAAQGGLTFISNDKPKNQRTWIWNRRGWKPVQKFPVQKQVQPRVLAKEKQRGRKQNLKKQLVIVAAMMMHQLGSWNPERSSECIVPLLQWSATGLSLTDQESSIDCDNLSLPTRKSLLRTLYHIGRIHQWPPPGTIDAKQATANPSGA